MTCSVIWEPAAIDLATTKFLADDPDGLRDVFRAVDDLCAARRPAGVFALGTSGLFRLRVDHYRVVYDVDDDARLIKVRHLTRAISLSDHLGPRSATSAGSMRFG